MNSPSHTSDATMSVNLDHSCKMLDRVVTVTSIVDAFESNPLLSPSSLQEQKQHRDWCLDLNVLNQAQKSSSTTTRHYRNGCPGLSYMLYDEDEDSLDLAAYRLGRATKNVEELELCRNSRTLQFDEHQQQEGEQDKMGVDWEYLNDDEALPPVGSMWQYREYTTDLKDDVDFIVKASVGGTVTTTTKKRRPQRYVHNNKNGRRVKT